MKINFSWHSTGFLKQYSPTNCFVFIWLWYIPFLCVYVCYVHAVLFVYVCTYGCGGQRSMSWPSFVTLHLVFKVGPLTEPGAHWLGKSHLVNKLWCPPVSPPQHQSYWFVTWLLGIQIQFLVLAWHVHYWTHSFDACFLNYKREKVSVTLKTPSLLSRLQRACCPGTLCLQCQLQREPQLV